MPRHKIKEHIKGRGDQGSEKQYQGQPERLRAMSKQDLYQRARKADLPGRSRMNKEQLVRELAKREK